MPGFVWLGAFIGAPLLVMLVVSFLTRGDYGELEARFTWDNYRRLAGWGDLGFDPVYPRVLGRTVGLAGMVTVMALGLALPVAFTIAELGKRWRGVVLALVVVPFWTNLLIRTYAWQLLLSAGGPLARVGVALGWIPEGGGLQPGWGAVVVAMLGDFLPFMILPVYGSVEKIDWSLAEAAADLGASPRRVFWHAVWPQILPGVRAGVLLVFLPALGQFVIPDLLGGGQAMLLGNLVQQQFGVSRDWPLGAAAAVLALGLLGLGLAVVRPGAGDVRREPFP